MEQLKDTVTKKSCTRLKSCRRISSCFAKKDALQNTDFSQFKYQLKRKKLSQHVCKDFPSFKVPFFHLQRSNLMFKCQISLVPSINSQYLQPYWLLQHKSEQAKPQRYRRSHSELFLKKQLKNKQTKTEYLAQAQH